jgi:peptide/nickel transport system permease protein
MSPSGFVYSFTERVLIEVFVLTMLTLPILGVLIGNESSSVMKKDYIYSARALGASKWHLIRKHILPSLKEKFVIMFGQQVVQVLLLFSHLGLLKLFFGGTFVSYDPLFKDPPSSYTLESGLIGDAQRYLLTAIWIPLTPIIFFAITIYAVNLMVEGYTTVNLGETRLKKKKTKHSKLLLKEQTINASTQVSNFELKHENKSV